MKDVLVQTLYKYTRTQKENFNCENAKRKAQFTIILYYNIKYVK